MTKVLILVAILSQFPSNPSKTQPQPALPSKTTPLASPQQEVQASPQQAYEAPAVGSDVVVVARAPRVYAVRQRVVLAAPTVSYSVQSYAAPATCAVGADTLAYADCGVAQNVVVQRNVIQHQTVVSHGVQNAVVSHGAVAATGRQPKKIKTKQVTKVKRGLFGGRG